MLFSFTQYHRNIISCLHAVFSIVCQSCAQSLFRLFQMHPWIVCISKRLYDAVLTASNERSTLFRMFPS